MKKKRKIQIDSKHLLIILLLLIISAGIAAAGSVIDIAPVKNAAGTILIPFENGVNKIGSWMNGIQKDFQDVKALTEENEQLKAQVESLTMQNNELVQSQSQMERLQKLYELDRAYGQYDKILAEVIAKDGGNWYSTFKINKGTDDGLKVDQNVLSGGGLVGIITDIGSNWATVRTIIDDDSNVSGETVSTADTCIVSGDLELMDSGKIRFSQLNNEKENLKVGENIVTSNISDKYVKGLLIGSISDIETDSNNLTSRGYLIPAADFNNLHEVLVITNLKEDGGSEADEK